MRITYGMAAFLAATTFLGLSNASAQPEQGARRGGFPSFETMDKNKDGKITKDEFTGPERFFQRLDRNSDGAITKDEIDAMRQSRRGGRGNFDPAQFEQRMLERYKEVLGVTDDEWKAMEPLVKNVLDAERDMRPGGFGRGGFGRSRGGAATRSTMPERDALRSALETKDTPADTITAKLDAYRKALAAKEAKLKTARDKLREVLTPRQEAELVLMGTLD